MNTDDDGDYPKPNFDDASSNDNYRRAKRLSETLFQNYDANNGKKRVIVIGGGLSGLSCGKYLTDLGYSVTVVERANVLGGKVSAWRDKDGDWIETGLHVFFGAYPNAMNLFKELDIEDRLQWKKHTMCFAMKEYPGEFTEFWFPEKVPAPFNMAAAILTNDKMLSWGEKVRTGLPLLPMLIGGQKYIDAQDELSVEAWMKKNKMPQRVSDELFTAMGKALDFIDSDKLSMTVILTAMNRFINETDGSKTAFLDGNQPDRLCKPMKEYIEGKNERGTKGEVLVATPLREIMVDDTSGEIVGVRVSGGSDGRNNSTSGSDSVGGEEEEKEAASSSKILTADHYVSAMSVDALKLHLPAAWKTMPFFKQLDELSGVPVINVHLWFDRKLRPYNGLVFSRSKLLSVYADMSECCKEYANKDKTMLELVFAPCDAQSGADVNWIKKSDGEIVAATMLELERLFPDEIKDAVLLKSAVVKTPRSVYRAIPGRNKFRPSQSTPIRNFTLAGDFTFQKYLGSMEGAILSGKLASEVVDDRLNSSGKPTFTIPPKEVHESVVVGN